MVRSLGSLALVAVVLLQSTPLSPAQNPAGTAPDVRFTMEDTAIPGFERRKERNMVIVFRDTLSVWYTRGANQHFKLDISFTDPPSRRAKTGSLCDGIAPFQRIPSIS